MIVNTSIIRKKKKQQVEISFSLKNDNDGRQTITDIKVFEKQKEIKNYSIAEVLKEIDDFLERGLWNEDL